MKLLIVLAFIAVFAAVNAEIPKEDDEEHNKIIAECRQKFKMTDEEYTKLRHDEVAKPNEDMQCFVNCFMESAGMIKDGKLQHDVATAIISKKVGEEKAKTILETCHGEQGSTNCETAYKLHKCLYKNKAY
ncbi:general odorant-binding protein 56a-like [Eupeodes corollae]|uniref:OBP36 n=2 Tax=Syrphini TaxID=115274 RepID=A0A6H0D3E9_EPIBA|nr:general odorant-binding protein 56a-like [Eupeodes corollae]QIS77229.1 OBP36 [Episyrphus balteatus]QYL00054.1 OBP31 [Eupeodes corollae]